MGSQEESGQRREARTFASGVIPRNILEKLCEGSFNGRLFNPLIDGSASDRLRQQCERWSSSGSTVVFTSGVYDMFHLNHMTSLVDSRVSAIPYHYRWNDAKLTRAPWEELATEQQEDYIRQTLTGGHIKQVVSVDGNAAVAKRKGFSANKGNMDRPVYDWETRAREVLAASIVVDGISLPIVDAVTVHDNQHPELAGSPHGGIMEIAAYISPDIWSICSDTEDVISAFEADRDAVYKDIEPVILPPREMYRDRLLGGRILNHGNCATNWDERYGVATISSGSARICHRGGLGKMSKNLYLY